LATGIHADLTVITVSSSRQSALSVRGAAALKAAFELAESLGAKTVTLAADDIAAEVIRYARANNFTTILVGKPPRSRFRQAFMGSVVDEIIRLSGSIDVLVVNMADSSPDQSPTLKLERRGYEGYIAAFGVILVSTGIGLLIAPLLKETNVAMMYLLGPTWIGFRYGRRESLFAAVLAVLAFDLSIVPPQGSFAVSDAQYIVTFAVMLTVAVTTSTLAQRLRRQASEVSQRERSTAVLYEVSRHMSGTRKAEDMVSFAAMKVSEVTGAEVAIGVIRDEEPLNFLVSSPSQFEIIPKEQGTWTWVIDNLKPAGRSTDTLAGSEGLYLPLLAESRCLGVVGIQLPNTDRLDFGARHLIDAICSQLSSSLERVRLGRESIQATVRAEAEKSRNSLLSAVSHDLRTPLAAIQGSANLISSRSDVADDVKYLSTGIEREADRMGKLVRNLLDMSRVEGAELVLARDWHSMEELIATSVERTESLFSKEVEVAFHGEIPLVQVDGILIEQVLVNLLENAARHGDSKSPVKISVHSAAKSLQIDVFNHGSTVMPADLTRIFEKFHRTGTEGFGLGLAICRAIIRAHGGRIWAENRPPDGIVFRIELPVS
jgi:two-component system sensor histidine kinase KdpD